MKIQINQTAWDVIKKDAEATFPHECCGFLFGHEQKNAREITIATVVDNTRQENRERRFEISAIDYMKAEHYALENHLKLLGVYHSHPQHPAIPSEYDSTHALPYFSYVIVSVIDGKSEAVTSWRLNEQKQFDEEQINSENLIHLLF